MDDSDILDAAADYILQHGLNKGSLFNYGFGNSDEAFGAPACGLGATIMAKYGDRFSVDPTWNVLWDKINQVSRELKGVEFSVFNDAPDTTPEMVCDFLREIAVRWRLS